MKLFSWSGRTSKNAYGDRMDPRLREAQRGRMQHRVIRNGMLVLLATFAIGAHGLVSAADPKPELYNNVASGSTQIDEHLATRFADRYMIVEVTDRERYRAPKLVSGDMPRTARATNQEFLAGSVLVGYVITSAGEVSDAFVLESSDSRLNSVALTATRSFRFEPGAWDARSVPVAAAQRFEFEAAPTEHELQRLDAIGAMVLRPKSWFVSTSEQGPRVDYVISREDSTKGAYVTGVRIQVFTQVRAGTGKSANEFIDGVRARLVANATRVVSDCPGNTIGAWQVRCLEVIEGPYHIQYSLHTGGADNDIAIVVVAGTRTELWEVYRETLLGTSALALGVDHPLITPAPRRQ